MSRSFIHYDNDALTAALRALHKEATAHAALHAAVSPSLDASAAGRDFHDIAERLQSILARVHCHGQRRIDARVEHAQAGLDQIANMTSTDEEFGHAWKAGQ